MTRYATTSAELSNSGISLASKLTAAPGAGGCAECDTAGTDTSGSATDDVTVKTVDGTVVVILTEVTDAVPEVVGTVVDILKRRNSL